VTGRLSLLDADGFPVSLEFTSPVESVTRTITVPADQVGARDVVLGRDAASGQVQVQRIKTYSRMPDQRSFTDQAGDLIPVARAMGHAQAADYLVQVIDPAGRPPVPTDPEVLGQLVALDRESVRQGFYDVSDFLRTVIGRR
jgi:hypothetical protein